MAIIVEEEKNRGKLILLLGWTGILIVIGATIYYIFLAAPELAIIQPTGNLGTIAPIANINLNPQEVVNGAAFQSRHPSVPHPSPTGPANVGRPNPFIAP